MRSVKQNKPFKKPPPWIVFMRWKAVFAGGVGFAILLGNTVGPTIELVVRSRSEKRKGRAKGSTAAAASGGAIP